MGYAQALDKAWSGITALTGDKAFSVELLSDTYDIDIGKRLVTSRSCGAPAKEYTAILILHYLARKLELKTLPAVSGEWIDFRQLEGGEGYYPTFKKRTIDRVIAKYGTAPEKLLSVAGRMNAKAAQFGDAGIVVQPFERVAILIKLSRGDDEFGPDGAILYDSNTGRILCTEDVVVLTELIVHQL